MNLLELTCLPNIFLMGGDYTPVYLVLLTLAQYSLFLNLIAICMSMHYNLFFIDIYLRVFFRKIVNVLNQDKVAHFFHHEKRASYLCKQNN